MSHLPPSLSQTLITGVYRTGSEYIAHCINRHPAIDVSMYRVNALRFIWGRYDPIGRPDNYRRALQDVAGRIRQRYGIEIDVGGIGEALDAQAPVDEATFYDVIMRSLYLGGPAVHWAEKNQLLWRQIPLFVDAMANGKAVLILRDPRSVLASFKAYTYAPPPAYLGAVFNCFDAMQCGLRYQTSLGPERFLCLRYEDFAREPEAQTERVWAFLGLPAVSSPQPPGPFVDAYGQPWYANSSFGENRADTHFDVEAAIGRWRHRLDEAELGLCETVCGEVMAAHGYERSGRTAAWPDVLRLFIEDAAVLAYVRRWLVRGEGIQAFPTDPLDPANWEETAPSTGGGAANDPTSKGVVNGRGR